MARVKACEEQVEQAKNLYPALFARVRELCDGAASNVDADHHAACIVLSAAKQAQSK